MVIFSRQRWQDNRKNTMSARIRNSIVLVVILTLGVCGFIAYNMYTVNRAEAAAIAEAVEAEKQAVQIRVAESVEINKQEQEFFNEQRTQARAAALKNIQDWKAEQARIAAEKEAQRVAEEQRLEAEKQAEQARIAAEKEAQRSARSPQQGNSDGTQADPAPSTSTSYAAQVQSAADQFCPGTKAVIDYHRLDGHKGIADWYNGIIGVKGNIEQWYSVTLHECGHMIQYQVFNGDVNALQNRMNEIYGGSGFRGLDQNADCIAKAWGASWLWYTSECGGARGEAAQAVIAGRIP